MFRLTSCFLEVIILIVVGRIAAVVSVVVLAIIMVVVSIIIVASVSVSVVVVVSIISVSSIIHCVGSICDMIVLLFISESCCNASQLGCPVYPFPCGVRLIGVNVSRWGWTQLCPFSNAVSG